MGVGARHVKAIAVCFLFATFFFFSWLLFCFYCHLKKCSYFHKGLSNYITSKGKELSKNKTRQNKMKSFKPLISTFLSIILGWGDIQSENL
jgi:hypothetical protein